MFKKVTLSLFLVFATNFALAGGDVIGNGGDVVHCEPSELNSYSGIYSLDYLATYRRSNDNSDLIPVSDWEESKARILENLQRLSPYLFHRFRHFVRYDGNHNPGAPRSWDEVPHGLENLADEDLRRKLPENCAQSNVEGELSLIQAVIRSRSHGDRLVYEYDYGIYSELRTHHPVQFSFLMVHEWLWDEVERTGTAREIRKLNRILHSSELDEMDPETFAKTVEGITGNSYVVPESGFYDFGDRDTFRARIQFIDDELFLFIKEEDWSSEIRSQPCRIDNSHQLACEGFSRTFHFTSSTQVKFGFARYQKVADLPEEIPHWSFSEERDSQGQILATASVENPKNDSRLLIQCSSHSPAPQMSVKLPSHLWSQAAQAVAEGSRVRASMNVGGTVYELENWAVEEDGLVVHLDHVTSVEITQIKARHDFSIDLFAVDQDGGGNELATLKFSLSGSSTAIDQMQAQCR